MSQLIPLPQHRVMAAPHAAPEGFPPEADPQRAGSSEIAELLALLRRHLPLIIVVSVITTALAAAVAYTRPARYTASAAVRLSDARRALTGGIEEQAVMDRLTGSMVDPVLSQMEVLRSRTLVGRALDEGGLRLRAVDFPMAVLADPRVGSSAPEIDTLALRFGDARYTVRGRAGQATAAYGAPVQVGGVAFTIAARPPVAEGHLALVPREAGITFTLDKLYAKQRDRTDVVDLRFEAHDSASAQRTLNGLVRTFQTVNAERAQDASRRRRIFLEEQLRTTDSLLTRAQGQLSAFRQQERAYSTRERFMAEQQGLMALDLRREELASQRSVYQSLLSRAAGGGDASALAALVSNPELAENPAIAQLNMQLLRYVSSRDSLLSGSHPRARTDPDVQRLESLVSSTRGRLADAARSQVAAVDVRLAALDQLRGRHVSQIEGLPSSEAEEVRLAQQVTTISAMADQLREEYQKARISEAIEAGQVEVLDYATSAERVPFRRSLMMLIGCLAGLLLGGGMAAVGEQLNTKLRRRDEIETLLGVTNLAVVPPIQGAAAVRRFSLGRGAAAAPALPRGSMDTSVINGERTRTAAAEAFRTLRTNLMFSQAVQTLRTLVVTSAAPAEGKSTTAANVAAVYARQGLRVLLVDCDLRRPRVHTMFDVPREPGFTQYIMGQGNLSELAVATPVQNLRVLPAGTLPPNPAELLGSARAREVVRLLGDQFDLVIFDTPPLLMASDPAILGTLVDGVLLVLRAGRTSRDTARQAVRQLEAVGAHVLGTVLNDPDGKLPRYEGHYGGYSYGYGYGSYYGEDQEAEEQVPATV